MLQSTWEFKKKRYPDGVLKKREAVFETHGPVASWITVRILLLFSLVLGLATQQGDYTNAFCHEPLYQTIFVELPKGFKMHNQVLHL